MYDEIVKNVDLTSDELLLLIQLLEEKSYCCLSLGEELVFKDLLGKLRC